MNLSCRANSCANTVVRYSNPLEINNPHTNDGNDNGRYTTYTRY